MSETAAGQQRTAGRGSAGSGAGFPGRAGRSRRRVAAVAAVAIVLLAALGIGITPAIQHAGQRSLLVIGDDPGGAAALAGSAADPGKWEKLPLAWDGGPVYSIAIDPSDSSIIYAGTGEGVYKSTDGAGSWSRLLADGVGQYTVSLDPASPTLVFATRIPNVVGVAPVMWRSNDAGARWTDLSDTALGEAVRREWSKNNGGMEPYAQFDTSTVPSTVYVRLDTGWMRSLDAGETWIQADAGEEDKIQTSVSGNPRPLDLGLFPGAGLGGPPVVVDGTDGARRSVHTTAVDPGDASVVYAGSEEGLYKSTDGGAIWQRKSRGLTCSAVSALLVAPDAAATLYAVTPREMWKSTDGGATWHAILAAGALDLHIEGNGGTSTWDSGSLVVAPSSPLTLYAWGRDGLLRSEDGGREWMPITPQGLPSIDLTFAGNGFDYELLLVSAADPDIVFAQAQVGPIVRSADGGHTWTQLPDHPSRLVPDPNEPTTLYGVGLLSEDGRVLEPLLRKSVDAGATWMTLSPSDSVKAYQGVFVDASRTPSALYAFGGGPLAGDLVGVPVFRRRRYMGTGRPGEPHRRQLSPVLRPGLTRHSVCAYTRDDA